MCNLTEIPMSAKFNNLIWDVFDIFYIPYI